MVNNVLVDNSMRDTRVLTGRGAALGDKTHVVEVVPLEFRSLMPYYPILLARDPDADQFMFVAICGFEDGENLFLDGDSWSVPYIPANVRRQPFNVIGTEGTNDNGEAMQVPALSIDLDSPRISATEGEKLFDSEGEPTTYLAEMSNMMMGVVNSPSLANLIANSAAVDLFQFSNGIEGPGPFGFQAGVSASSNGDLNYSPMWRIFQVTWMDSENTKVLKTINDINTNKEAGLLEVTLARPMGADHIVNCPFIDPFQ